MRLTLIPNAHQHHTPPHAEATVSIVRQGLAEDAKFGDGYEAIFGKKESVGGSAKAEKKPTAKKATAKKKPAAKKKK
jgi:hypothetical protein